MFYLTKNHIFILKTNRMYLNIYLNNSLNMRKKAINKDFLINIFVFIRKKKYFKPIQ